MDYEFAVLADDDLVKLEERQDLSQYSYDPTDTMECVNPFIYESSQPSSQDKLFDSVSDCLLQPLGGGDSDSTENDNNEIDLMYLLGVDKPEQFPFAQVAHTVDQQTMDSKSSIVEPAMLDLVGNELQFDVTSPSAASTVPDSTTYFNLALEEWENTESPLVSDKELLTMATRDLNRKIRHYSAEQQREIKSRRRTLKNRGYAQTCRTRRIGQRHQLEDDKDHLVDEVTKLKNDNNRLNAECDRLRKEGSQYKMERDFCQNRLQELLNLLATSGYVVQDVD